MRTQSKLRSTILRAAALTLSTIVIEENDAVASRPLSAALKDSAPETSKILYVRSFKPIRPFPLDLFNLLRSYFLI